MTRRANRRLRWVPLCLLVAATMLLGAGGAQAQSSGARHTLTNADNDATVNAAVGDTIVLKLDPSLNWTVSLDNPSLLFRPPLALAAGVQGEWEIIGTGEVTVSATGDPACRQATPACAAPSQTWQATISVAGTLHSLTAADSGTTVTVRVNDYLRLDVAPLQAQGAAASNPSVLAPVSIGLYHGTLFQAIGAGQVTLTATLNPACYPQCLIASQTFTVTVQITLPTTPPGPPPASDPEPARTTADVTYAEGWNLVGVPDGTTLPVDADLWQPQQGSYTIIPAGQPLTGGNGYWAYFSTPTTVTISGGRPSAVLAAPANDWVMVGDPSATVPVTVNAADVLFTWDPVAGQYTRSSGLGPGQGGWAMRAGGGNLLIAPAP